MPRKMEHLHSKVPDLKSCLQEPLVLLSDSMREEADPVSHTGRERPFFGWRHLCASSVRHATRCPDVCLVVFVVSEASLRGDAEPQQHSHLLSKPWAG